MANDSLIGKTLANFRIDSRLGQGGMAVVYLGMDIQLDRPVAIKLINAQFQGNPEYAERFVSEAKLVARWRHENIISVYYADQQDDLYYFVMEYIDGATLEDLLKRYLMDAELMPHEDVIRIGRAVANGLDYAHQQGVVHRDVKPANIMIDRNDRVVVTDFGLALDMGQGSMGQIFGTPHYVAPEQVRHSADASPQSDIYSLGIVLYEMLTGILPFDDPSAMALAVQHLSEPPPPPRIYNPALGHDTEDTLLKALAKEPEDRFETATTFIDALEIALQTPGDENETVPDIMLPAAITKRVHEVPKVSMMSISDILELELAEKEPIVPVSEHRQETQKAVASEKTEVAKSNRTAEAKKVNTVARPKTIESPPQKKSNMPLYAGIGLVGIMIVAVIAFVFSASGNDSGEEATATVESTTEEAIAQVATDEPIVAQTDDMTATSGAIINVTNAFISTQNASVLATNEANDAIGTQGANIQATNDANDTIALATSNAQMEATLTQQANQPVVNVPATQLYPNGQLLEMTYNSAGFYLRNSSEDRVRDNRLAFQAIDGNGNGVGQPFDGGDWARFYNFIDGNGRCVVIELTDQASWNRPTNCVSASGSQYNSQLSFPDTDERIFWDGANGAVQFIIYWDNSEIARCGTANGYCQVRVGE